MRVDSDWGSTPMPALRMLWKVYEYCYDVVPGFMDDWKYDALLHVCGYYRFDQRTVSVWPWALVLARE